MRVTIMRCKKRRPSLEKLGLRVTAYRLTKGAPERRVWSVGPRTEKAEANPRKRNDLANSYDALTVVVHPAPLPIDTEPIKDAPAPTEDVDDVGFHNLARLPQS